jgi:hypothetical protein
MDRWEGTGHGSKPCVSSSRALSPVHLIPGPEAVTKRRELLPDSPPASPSSRVLPPASPRWFRNASLIPFRASRAFAWLLGPTHPWTFAVPMETFPTSVFQVNPSNRCYYHQDLHDWRFQLDSHPTFVTSSPPSYLLLRHVE